MLRSRNACNSKSHTEDRCWWIHPELRPNIQSTIMPGKVQDIVNQNTNQKQEKLNSVSDLLSIMTAMQGYIKLQMPLNFSEDIKLHLINYLQGVSAFLSISKYGNVPKYSR